MKYRLECGCEFEQIGTELKKEDGLPAIDLDLNNIPSCPVAWKAFHDGHTKGVFQLENKLGQEWSLEAKPNTIDEIAALIAIIRPGVLKSSLNGKSLAKHYTDRKNGKDDVGYIHPSLEDILEATYGVLTFQEQVTKIVQKLAGFSEEESETVRKAIGKKKSDIMAKVKQQFLDGCKKENIVNEEIAQQIFDWIEEGQKYLFNLCLDPSTVVETPNGHKMISELKLGDFVNSPDGFIEVTDIINQGDQEVYEIELESGHSIMCTLTHKFMCSDNKIRPLYEILDQNLEICHDLEYDQ